ncbi:tripartite tricarboxylate transporter substrate binding protein [Roseomonas sp. NAR14]|uniref:Tripartite tricarboxylate transporter substrate binding protein n=1 Tax=Roseomonas acroporae TaxID=2937791 RepID=A0A9X2C077_9PROT|nr:tripartite tricarboxylate transporter substrate binding protein [Roseomonas acroporae]MCK8787875.1 tripartite tricarboxylate transporter substrate binding protein [Roseomonas acroporae]
MRRRTLLGLAAASPLATALAMPRLARAESWPDRPVRLIVPWPPGGSTDTVARIMQPRLQEVLGKAVVIDNRGGASGSVGAAEAARAPADGYTWMLAYDTQATNETVMRLPFRTMEAFAPVCLVADGPLALVAHRSTPWRSLPELIEDAKRRPEQINYATSGIGGLAHVATTLLQQQGGFRLTHVPYRGGGPALQGALAGDVPLFMSNVVIISQHIREGTLRPLGVTTAGETRHVPGVRSFAQQGFGGFQAPTWWAMLAPARTPDPIVRQMHDALVRVLADPEVKGKIEEQGADVRATSPEQCGEFLRAEIEKWGRVIRDNGIRTDS